MLCSVNGHRVHVATGGRPVDGTHALVFVHGAGMDHSVWQQQARFFAHRDHTVLAVDLPGHGGSEGPALAAIPAIADWLIRLIGETGIERAILIGHSMGALAAIAAAARHPAAISALALLGVAARMPVHPALLAAAAAEPAQAAAMIAGWGHGERAQRGGNAVPGIWMTGLARRLIERTAPGVLATDLIACNRYIDAVDDAARTRCPVQLILGAQDRMTPPKGAKPLRAAFGDARETILPGIGHMVMSEAPAAVRATLHEFIEHAATRSEG